MAAQERQHAVGETAVVAPVAIPGTTVEFLRLVRNPQVGQFAAELPVRGDVRLGDIEASPVERETPQAAQVVSVVIEPFIQVKPALQAAEMTTVRGGHA